MKTYLLKGNEIDQLEAELKGWKVINNHIEREFIFKDFIEAFSFMTKIALISEKYNHHPDLQNIYSKVIIKFTTHDLGGISNLDKVVALEINNII